MSITRNVAKAIQITKESGIRGLAAKLQERAVGSIRRRWTKDLYFQGRIVELLGNRVRIDGLKISVDNPYFDTPAKSGLLKQTYEEQERKLIQRYLQKDTPVIELGANIGVVACLVNRQLQDSSQHVVVEPHPYIVKTLEQNRQLNHCHFDIVNAALAYGSTSTTFYLQDRVLASGLYQKGGRSVEVPTTTLESVAAGKGFSRFSLICDIEGAEVDLVAHELDYLQNHVAWFLVEMHPQIVGNEPIDRIMLLLSEHKFVCVEKDYRVYYYRNQNLVAG